MKPVKVEERLIAFLSKMAQLTSAYLGLNVLLTAGLLSGIFAVSTVPVFTVLFSFINNVDVNLGKLLWQLCSIFLLINFIFLVSVYIHIAINLYSYTNENIISNTYKNPNPNKYTSWLLCCRLSVPCLLTASIILCYKEPVTIVPMFLCYLGITVGFYTLCADKPLPKQKRETKQKITLAFEGQ